MFEGLNSPLECWVLLQARTLFQWSIEKIVPRKPSIARGYEESALKSCFCRASALEGIFGWVSYHSRSCWISLFFSRSSGNSSTAFSLFFFGHLFVSLKAFLNAFIYRCETTYSRCLTLGEVQLAVWARQRLHLMFHQPILSWRGENGLSVCAPSSYIDNMDFLGICWLVSQQVTQLFFITSWFFRCFPPAGI